LFFLADFVLDNRRLWGPNETPNARTSTHRQQQLPLNKDGQYPVQQATFNDADGEYSLILLNTPATPTFRTTNLQMARLTDEEIKAGQRAI